MNIIRKLFSLAPPASQKFSTGTPGTTVEYAAGQPQSSWCATGTNPWIAWENASQGGWSTAGNCWTGLTNYTSDANAFSSVENQTNRVLQLYSQRGGAGTEFDIMPNTWESNLANMGTGAMNFDNQTVSSQLDGSAFTCSRLLQTTSGTTSNFWSNNLQIYNASTSGDAARTQILQNTTDTATGWSCYNRAALQTCLNNRAAGQILDPTSQFYTKLLQSPSMSGYVYNASQGNANACNVLIQNYCNTGTNMQGAVCQSILNDTSDPAFNGTNILSSTFATYCQSNLTSSECMAYCAGATTNCDVILDTFCGKYSASEIAGNAALLKACGAVMNLQNPQFYSSQCSALSASYPALETLCGRPECWYPAAQQALKTMAMKTALPCPSETNCISNISVDNSGQVQGNTIQLVNSQACGTASSNSGSGNNTNNTGTSSSGDSSTNTNTTTSSSTNYQIGGHTFTKTDIIGIVVAVIVAIALIIILIIAA